jgi:hypothetical protein
MTKNLTHQRLSVPLGRGEINLLNAESHPLPEIASLRLAITM